MHLGRYLIGVSFVDVETTGGKAESNRIFEIGIVRVENQEITETYQQLIDPQEKIHWAIKKKTGVKQDQVDGQPTFTDLFDKIRPLIENSLIVAHNAVFDYSFLQAEFQRIGEDLVTDTLCTMKLAKKLYPSLGKYGLEFLCGHFDIDSNQHHRALEDAMSTWKLCQKFKQENSKTDMIHWTKKCIKSA